MEKVYIPNWVRIFFVLKEEGTQNISQLARYLNLFPTNLHYIILEMEEKGIIFTEKQGKYKYLFLNKKYTGKSLDYVINDLI